MENYRTRVTCCKKNCPLKLLRHLDTQSMTNTPINQPHKNEQRFVGCFAKRKMLLMLSFYTPGVDETLLLLSHQEMKLCSSCFL